MQERKEINIEIGQRIKEAREKAGLTQERFSELIGLGPKSVSALERGTVGISLTTLKKICLVLSISSDQILFGEREKNELSQLAAAVHEEIESVRRSCLLPILGGCLLMSLKFCPGLDQQTLLPPYGAHLIVIP